ncbi:MAG: SDR family oxidoreductase [Acidobacteria bacterium]|nr:SDR family oxidoreductase [Acidobacteriota bacterium]
MTESLQGKVAVVTGGSRGIGRAIAHALLAEGARVAICGRDAAALDQAASELSADGGDVIGKVCNVGRWEEVEAFFAFVADRFGGVDVLVNNAGLGHFAPVDEITVEQWREVIDTNLSGVFYCVKAATPSMKARGGGFILNIGSLAGKNPFANGAAYNASKFGLVGFTEASMIDLRFDGIRVSEIMPGSVQTDFRPGGSEGADWKLDPAEIAAMAVHLIKTPRRNLASLVEMRPSMPPKR